MFSPSLLQKLPSHTSLFFIGAFTSTQADFMNRFMLTYLPFLNYTHIPNFNEINPNLTNICDGFFIPATEFSTEYQLIIQHMGAIGSVGLDNDYVIGYDTKEYFLYLIETMQSYHSDHTTSEMTAFVTKNQSGL